MIKTRSSHLNNHVFNSTSFARLTVHSSDIFPLREKAVILSRLLISFDKDIGKGVVDPKRKVHSVNRLRIADASIISVIPDCCMQSTMYIIGEKAADLIKANHKDLFK